MLFRSHCDSEKIRGFEQFKIHALFACGLLVNMLISQCQSALKIAAIIPMVKKLVTLISIIFDPLLDKPLKERVYDTPSIPLIHHNAIPCQNHLRLGSSGSVSACGVHDKSATGGKGAICV